MGTKKFLSDSHRIAIVETGVILIFTILPTIAGISADLINSNLTTYSKFYKSGEVLLYSVSLLSGAYLVFNKFKVSASDWKRLISMIIVVVLLLLSLLYALIIVATNPNLVLIRNVSLIFFIISVVLFYNSQVLSNKNSPDISAQRTQEQEAIANELQ